MSELEIYKIAYQIHHGQLSARRQKIHSITSTTVGFLLILVGWVLAKNKGFNRESAIILVGFASVISFVAIYNLYTNSKAYVQIANILFKVNNALGLYQPSELLDGDALYPKAWKKYESLSWFKTVAHHIIFIVFILVATCWIILRSVVA